MRVFHFLFCFALVLTSACPRERREGVSPSGSYRTYLSIHQGADGCGFWVVNISGDEDKVELLEFMNDYPANLMAYIAWDERDRLWFYSSDDGSYYYWDRTDDGHWSRYSWSILETSRLSPPQSLADHSGGGRR